MWFYLNICIHGLSGRCEAPGEARINTQETRRMYQGLEYSSRLYFTNHTLPPPPPHTHFHFCYLFHALTIRYYQIPGWEEMIQPRLRNVFFLHATLSCFCLLVVCSNSYYRYIYSWESFPRTLNEKSDLEHSLNLSSANRTRDNIVCNSVHWQNFSCTRLCISYRNRDNK